MPLISFHAAELSCLVMGSVMYVCMYVLCVDQAESAVNVVRWLFSEGTDMLIIILTHSGSEG